MNNFFRAIIAGYGAKKLGGGCFGTILVFVLIWVALGQCSFSSREVPPPETYPADRRAHIEIEDQLRHSYTCYPDATYAQWSNTFLQACGQPDFAATQHHTSVAVM